jgi:hypothetical protein
MTSTADGLQPVQMQTVMAAQVRAEAFFGGLATAEWLAFADCGQRIRGGE